MKKRFSLSFAIALYLCVPIPGHGSTFTVTHTKDDGSAGSLRWAVQQVNVHAGPDDIEFSMPTSDAGFNGHFWTIRLGSPLPALSDPGTRVFGFTQIFSVGDFNPSGVPIFIDGRDSGGDAVGFEIISSKTVVSGLSICGFSRCGIAIRGKSAVDYLIARCHVGISAGGFEPIPNHAGIVISEGARLSPAGHLPNVGIGWCCISYNTTHGILIDGAHDNIVAMSVIGANARGTAAAGNGVAGICIRGASTGNRIGDPDDSYGNLISGNAQDGILISDAGTRRNAVLNNRIGTDSTGIRGIGNGVNGVRIANGATANIVGPGNVVSGNAYGVIINGAGTDSNRVSGNWVGLDATGTDTLPNFLHGLRVENGARHNVIGGESREFRNIFSGNGWSGMGTAGDSTAYNLFAYNWCGLDSSGTRDLGNAFYGVHFGGLANRVSYNNLSGNRCGVVLGGYSEKCVVEINDIGIDWTGETSIPNDEAGVRVLDNARLDSVRFNNISGNGAWGVELRGQGVRNVTVRMNAVTLNGSGGILLDGEANGGIVPPVILHADPGTGTIRGKSAPHQRVEVFQDADAQGAFFLGAATAEDGGDWELGGLRMIPGLNVTATATDGQGNTSTFSAPFALSSGIVEPSVGLPHGHALFQNYPNPFNPETTFRFHVKEPCRVVLKVYDVLGKEVAILADGRYNRGNHTVLFNASGLPSGIYVYKIQMRDFTAVRKMVVVE